MDSFEALVGSLLEKDGYWVRANVKVELTPKEKRKIDRPSSPRWELDIVAYKANTNDLLVVECKSLLDSPGIKADSVIGKDPKFGDRYKLFNDAKLRRVVLNRVVKQLVSSGACAQSPTVHLCLAAGKIRSQQDREVIGKLFKRNKWMLFDESWLVERLGSVSRMSYENDIASFVAKLLLRTNRNDRKK